MCTDTQHNSVFQCGLPSIAIIHARCQGRSHAADTRPCCRSRKGTAHSSEHFRDLRTRAMAVKRSPGGLLLGHRSRIYTRLVRLRSCVGVLTTLLALLMLASGAEAFNVDLNTVLVHQGPKGSMFGYAVAQHIDQSTNWLLVGAPKSNTSQTSLKRPGAVFRCRTDHPNDCHMIPFDEKGNNVKYSKLKFEQIEEKSDQWFGATLRSSGENGFIVACAPRYVYFTNDLDKREPIGACFLSRPGTTQFERYSPCMAEKTEKNETGFNRQGYCQAGFSATISKDGRKLLIGAPGSWYWQGQLFNFRTDLGELINKTSEGKPTEDDTYMGYASAVGQFDEDGIEDYVVGIPKGEQHVGKVEFYNQNLTLFGSLVGDQIGSYFGSSLAVFDINGDRLDDIIVGAPMYADYTSVNSYDTGRVYIFYQGPERKFRPTRQDILDGPDTQSRFGMALSGLRDINYDGFEDLCVGAPYGGEEKRGAIYIYHGAKRGIITAVSQTIHAKTVSPTLSAFGISISGGLDQDANYYPDILVGAYASDSAVFFRTRPVVKVIASLKIEPDNVDLETKSCTLADGTKVTCITLMSCLSYDGYMVPEFLTLNSSWVLDAKDNTTGSREQRVFLLNEPTKYTKQEMFRLATKIPSCIPINAFVKCCHQLILGALTICTIKELSGQTDINHPVILKQIPVPVEALEQKPLTCVPFEPSLPTTEPDDKLSPIKMTMSFSLIEDLNLALRPILDATIPKTASVTAQIKKDCGIDDVCVPDLAVEAYGVTPAHVIGNPGTLEILVIVFNNEEDSFNTRLWIYLPPGVAYNTISNQRSSVPISCGNFNQTLVVCDLGNPLKQNSKTSEFTLNLTPTNTNDTKDELKFNFYANSSNEEKSSNYGNNYAEVTIPVTAVAEIILFGTASPEFIVLNITEREDEEDSRIVKHRFQLDNQGQSATNETALQILWPSYDRNGNPVLPLDGTLLTRGNGKCHIIIITPSNASNFTNWIDSSANLAQESDRNKRNADSQTIMCSEKYCTIIQCLVGYMAPRDSFVLTVQSKFNARSFIQRREETQMYNIKSIANARVRSVPYDFKTVDVSKFESKRAEVVTTVNTDRLKPASKGVEMWIIALAVTAGLLMLLLLILLLWWCGFFKRKKPEEEGYFVVNGKSNIDNKIVD